MTLSLGSVPAGYYTAVGAAVLLLAWSIDNLIQKTINETGETLSTLESASIQSEFQRQVLDFLVMMRGDLSELTPRFPQDTARRPSIREEFQSLNSGQLKIMREATLKMQGLRVAAETQAAVFMRVELPDETQARFDAILGRWRNYTSTLSQSLSSATEHAQGVMLRPFGGAMPNIEQLKATKPEERLVQPTAEDISKLDSLVDAFWRDFGEGELFLATVQQNLSETMNLAKDYVRRKRERLALISKAISILYITLFIFGSVVSIAATIFQAQKG